MKIGELLAHTGAVKLSHQPICGYDSIMIPVYTCWLKLLRKGCSKTLTKSLILKSERGSEEVKELL